MKTDFNSVFDIKAKTRRKIYRDWWAQVADEAAKSEERVLYTPLDAVTRRLIQILTLAAKQD